MTTNEYVNLIYNNDDNNENIYTRDCVEHSSPGAMYSHTNIYMYDKWYIFRVSVVCQELPPPQSRYCPQQICAAMHFKQRTKQPQHSNNTKLHVWP